MSYIFKSEITKAALPLGVIGTHQVARDEVSNYLAIIKGIAEKKGAGWLELFVKGRIEHWDCWGIPTITGYLKHLQEDIEQLCALLNVPQHTTVKENEE